MKKKLGTRNPPEDELRFIIVLLSDLHITDSAADTTVMAGKALRTNEAQDADLVIVSGDITDHGADDEMKKATGILSSAKPVVLQVPGNHDIKANIKGVCLGGSSKSRAESVARVSDLARNQWKWNQLDAAPGGWPLRKDFADGKCVVYGLDSTCVGDGQWALARGRLGKNQLEALDLDLARLDPDQVPILVLHHHILRLPGWTPCWPVPAHSRNRRNGGSKRKSLEINCCWLFLPP